MNEDRKKELHDEFVQINLGIAQIIENWAVLAGDSQYLQYVRDFMSSSYDQKKSWILEQGFIRRIDLGLDFVRHNLLAGQELDTIIAQGLSCFDALYAFMKECFEKENLLMWDPSMAFAQFVDENCSNYMSATIAAFYCLSGGSKFVVREERPEVLRWIVSKPDNICVVNPQQFENIVSLVLKASGFRTELTKPTRDQGVDILCWTPGTFGYRTLTVVQVKRYTGKRKVSIDEILKLAGARNLFNADAAVCVSSTDFTSPARSTAKSLRINLVNFEKLKNEINRLFK